MIIPTAVHKELTHAHAPADVRTWAKSPPSWIEVRHPKLELDLDLDRGEREAIALALEVKADFVLLDEQEARAVAARSGLKVAGTLGVLEKAAESRLLRLEEAIPRLLRTNFRIERGLVEQLLRKVGEPKKEQ